MPLCSPVVGVLFYFFLLLSPVPFLQTKGPLKYPAYGVGDAFQFQGVLGCGCLC